MRHGDRQIGFEVGEHDRKLPLVTDPLLTYSSFLGGQAGDLIHGIAVDAAGNVYVTGSTDSGNFPTATPLQATNRRAPDAFVAKINPAGTALIYSTYLGGSSIGRGETGTAIAVDSAGNAIVTGFTSSSDFPTTAGALKRTLGFFGNAFVTKLSASGSTLLYSTYLGGGGPGEGSGIAVDCAGNAFVTGTTRSQDFPATPGAFQRSFAGGFPQGDGFVAKLNASGSSLLYATYLRRYGQRLSRRRRRRHSWECVSNWHYLFHKLSNRAPVSVCERRRGGRLPSEAESRRLHPGLLDLSRRRVERPGLRRCPIHS